MPSYTPSYPAMDKQAHERIEVQPITEKPDIEKPIFPMSEIGQTFPEQDPTGRFKNVIQTAQAAIRAGAGTLQLIMMTPPESAIGGRFKAYGAEVREALKSVAKASEVKLRGIEMPTSMNNLSGWDMQRNRFSEEVRKRYMDEIRDGIRFAAEVMDGGGIDMVSWEYQRGINDAKWNQKKEITLPSGKKVTSSLFSAPGEIEIVQVVDTTTGQVSQYRRAEVMFLPKKPGTDEELPFKSDGTPNLQEWTWRDFEKLAELKIDPDTGKVYGKDNAEKLYVQEQISAQKKAYLGQQSQYLRYYEQAEKQMKALQDQLTGGVDPRTKEPFSDKDKQELKTLIDREKTEIQRWKEAAEGNAQQAKELEERARRMVPVKDYALKRSMNSYAEAGVWAHQESVVKGQLLPHPIHVGPELGWPQYYGSHPDEWVELIRGARGRMKELLTKPFRTDWDGKTLLDINGEPLKDDKGKEVKRAKWTQEEFDKLPTEIQLKADNPYFVPGLSDDQAAEHAQKHIKGMFDTSHMGMFLQNFRPDLPWEKRVEEFNKWYLQQIDKIAEINKKEDIIGGIQAVDTQTGAHSHLPPGQGVLPVVTAVQRLKEKGNLKGYIVSEGHEEEKFGEGRILLKAWEAFGAHLNRDYFPAGGPAPLQWSRGFSNNYFGRTYSPLFMFGSYSPSNEFKLWSEIPLE
ncbi:hypothetical protein HY490_03145 [Candidatus Woesearchaeota archaeon]|nr:hypothetical protein [Candidatus Woesearchaeota archaeon]